MARYNYMLPRTEQIRRCSNGLEHYYVPISVRASTNSIGVRFVCKRCEALAAGFFTEEEYELRRNTIEKAIEKAGGTLA